MVNKTARGAASAHASEISIHEGAAPRRLIALNEVRRRAKNAAPCLICEVTYSLDL